MSFRLGNGVQALLLVVVCLWSSSLPRSAAYNVDTNHPVVYNGRSGSQFGYSISFHSDADRKM